MPSNMWGGSYPGSIFDVEWRHTTYKPLLLGKHWLAITGEPLSATAGARIFMRGGNAVDAGAAMLAAVCVMNDSVSFGGECPCLIYDPRQRDVFCVNGQGIAPSGATPEFFHSQGYGVSTSVRLSSANTLSAPHSIL